MFVIELGFLLKNRNDIFGPLKSGLPGPLFLGIRLGDYYIIPSGCLSTEDS